MLVMVIETACQRSTAAFIRKCVALTAEMRMGSLGRLGLTTKEDGTKERPSEGS